MSTTIGILGTGRMAVRLAKVFADSGNHVILGSRTPERATHITRGLDVAGIKPGTYEQAADAPVVLPAMFLRDGETYQAQPVQLGRRDGVNVEVVGGLVAGMNVVVANSYLVKADIEKSGASHDH